jgi:hypothetical protein
MIYMEKEKKPYRIYVSDDTIKYIRNIMLHSEGKIASWMKLEKELKISRKVMVDRLKSAHYWDYVNRCVK